MKITARDLINFGALSKLLTGRRDIIRDNRISKTYEDEVRELIELINYWLSKNKH